VILATLAFMLIYGGTMILLTLIQLATGLDPITAFTSIVACLNNTGPGLGQVGPASNYQGLSDAQTWVCTAAMLLGRLELFSVIVLFTPAFWRR
jgi:trk system potassium uptake protein TrkH